MSTLKEIVYSIRELLKQYSQDDDITNEYIAYLIKNARALLLEQRYTSRSNVIPNIARQSFYMDLELAEGNEIVDGIGTILRTKDPIQTPLEPFNIKNNIRINGGSYTDTYFSLVGMERLPFVGNCKWVQNQIYYSIGTDFRIYFVSSNPSVKLLDNIKLSMVCTDPEAAYPYTIGYNSSVDFWDTQYPLEENMITLIRDMIVKSLVNMLQMHEDKLNDSNDDSN